MQNFEYKNFINAKQILKNCDYLLVDKKSLEVKMFPEEQAKLQEIGQKALGFINSGEFKKADHQLRKLERSWMVVESMQISVPLHALSLIKQNKKKEAKKYCLEHMSYSWGDADLLHIIRQCNLEPTVGSKLFKFKIKGGDALFSMFSNKHKISFDVLADTKDEAFAYIDEIVQFSKPEECKIVELRQQVVSLDKYDKKGVYQCSSFSI